jgi:hypothetical protein
LTNSIVITNNNSFNLIFFCIKDDIVRFIKKNHNLIEREPQMKNIDYPKQPTKAPRPNSGSQNRIIKLHLTPKFGALLPGLAKNTISSLTVSQRYLITLTATSFKLSLFRGQQQNNHKTTL